MVSRAVLLLFACDEDLWTRFCASSYLRPQSIVTSLTPNSPETIRLSLLYAAHSHRYVSRLQAESLPDIRPRKLRCYNCIGRALYLSSRWKGMAPSLWNGRVLYLPVDIDDKP